mmetsp:Transcript_5708/g.14533  ORF Transcript_5708/g.14533 Transcript_5708/m.14533 type:complete len:208 (+) Transcript_5708:181-804(+)
MRNQVLVRDNGLEDRLEDDPYDHGDQAPLVVMQLAREVRDHDVFELNPHVRARNMGASADVPDHNLLGNHHWHERRLILVPLLILAGLGRLRSCRHLRWSRLRRRRLRIVGKTGNVVQHHGYVALLCQARQVVADVHTLEFQSGDLELVAHGPDQAPHIDLDEHFVDLHQIGRDPLPIVGVVHHKVTYIHKSAAEAQDHLADSDVDA